jgi:hypothetical protein
MNTVKEDADFGRDLIESLGQVRNHLAGKIALLARIVETMPTARGSRTPKSAAKTPK